MVAAHLAERLHTVLVRGMPDVVCDTDATPIDPATAKQLIAEHWTVPARSAPAVAAANPDPAHGRGKPLSTSSSVMTGQTPTGSTDEATFPAPLCVPETGPTPLMR